MAEPGPDGPEGIEGAGVAGDGTHVHQGLSRSLLRSRMERLRPTSISASRRPMRTQAGIVGTATMRGMMVLSAMRAGCGRR
jgi:hypothetical protein